MHSTSLLCKKFNAKSSKKVSNSLESDKPQRNLQRNVTAK